MIDGRRQERPVTPKGRREQVKPAYRGLTPESLAQQFDRGEDLCVLPPLAVVALDVGPSDPSFLVDQKVGPIGVEALLIEDSVCAGNVPPEVAQKVGFHLQLVL